MRFLTKTGTSVLYDFNDVKESFEYQIWQKNVLHQNLSELIYEHYIDYLVNPQNESKYVQFGSKGFSGAVSIIKLWPELGLSDLIFFQIFLVEKLQSERYIVQLSEEKLNEGNQKSYIIYLKPSYKLPLIDGKSDQKFGNIHLEIKIDNDQLVFFKMIVHKYHDYKYDEGLEFEELIELLFKVR